MTPCSRCGSASSCRAAQTSAMPRLIRASARSSSPRPGCAASGASAMACSRRACSATAGQVPPLAGQRQPDHPEQHPRLPAPACRHRRRPPLGHPQVPLRRLQRPPRQLIGGRQRRQLRIRRGDPGREPGQQLMRGAGLPVQQQPRPVPGQQPHRQLPVPRRLGMPDRLHREPVVRQPPRGRPVQPGNLTRRGTPQLQPQQVSEQPVVAEPRPRRVQRHHERVGLLQLLQHPLPAAPPGQQVSQLPVDPVQHAGHQQQPPHPLALPLQHLGHQVFGHRPLTAGKLRREPPRILAPGQRQRRQPQPRRPPLGPPVQHPQRRIRQLNPRRPEQLPRLGQAEPQIPPRISVSSPSSRNRCNPSRTPCRVASTNRNSSGPRSSSSSSCRRASADPSSCTSSTTSQTRSSNRARSFSSRSTTAHPSSSGAADSARTSPDPAAVRRSAPTTDSQNRCPSRSPASTGTHAARPPGPPPRSTTAATPSSRSPPAPTPPPPAPPPPAARTTPAGTPPPPHQGEPPGHQQNPIPAQAPPPDHRTSS